MAPSTAHPAHLAPLGTPRHSSVPTSSHLQSERDRLSHGCSSQTTRSVGESRQEEATRRSLVLSALRPLLLQTSLYIRMPLSLSTADPVHTFFRMRGNPIVPEGSSQTHVETNIKNRKKVKGSSLKPLPDIFWSA